MLSDADDACSRYDAFGAVKFHSPGMQREYMKAKGIKLKFHQEEGSAVQAMDNAQFYKRDPRFVS